MPFASVFSPKLIKGFMWLLGGGALSSLLTMLSTFIIASHLGVAGYGVIVLITSTVVLFSGVFTLRTVEAVTKLTIDCLEENNQDDARSVVRYGLLVDFCSASFAVILLLITAGWVVPLIFDSTDYLIYFQVYCLVPIFNFLYLPCVAMLRVIGKFSLMALLELVSGFILFVGSLVLKTLDMPWDYFFILMVVTPFFKGVLQVFVYIYAIKKSKISSVFETSRKLPSEKKKSLFKLMLSSSGAFITKTMHTQADTVLVGAILGPAQSGIYKLARSIIQMLALPMNALFQLTYPEFIKYVKQNKVELLYDFVHKLFYLVSGIFVFYLVLVWWVSPYLINWMLGNEFSGVSELLAIMVLGVGFLFTAQSWHLALAAINRMEFVALANSIALLVQVGISLAAIPILGAEGAACAYLSYCLIRTIIIKTKYNTYFKKEGFAF